MGNFIDLSSVPVPSPPGSTPSTARVWLGAAHADFASGHNLGALATGLVVVTAGVPSSIAHGTDTYVLTMVGGAPTWSAPSGGGGGAPVGAQYLTLALDGTLTAERVLTVTSGHLTLSDGGANGNATLALPNVGGGGAVGSALSVITTVTPDAQGRVASMAAVAGTASQVLKINGAGTAAAFGLIANANIDAAAAIDLTKLGNLAGNSLLGRAGAGSGAMAAITASTDGHLARYDGANVAFGQLRSGSAAGTATDGFVLTLSGGVPTWLAASGGGGTIDGSGTATHLASWTDSDTLQASGVTLSSNTLTHAVSSSGGGVTIIASNTSNTASSDAIIGTRVAGSSGGDAIYRAEITSGAIWSWGLDNSDSDAFVMSRGAVLGTTNFMRVVATSTVIRNDTGNAVQTLDDSVGCRLAYGSNMNLDVAGSDIDVRVNGGYALRARTTGGGGSGLNNIALFHSSGSFGSGQQVVFQGDATTAPSSNPTGGFIHWSAASLPTWRDKDGNVYSVGGA